MTNSKKWLEEISRETNSQLGKCVICGLPTSSTLMNYSREEYVHDYHEPESIGCKEVWRHRRELDRELERSHPFGDNLETEPDDERYLLDLPEKQDIFDDYDSYLHSTEWKIKAREFKRKSERKCQRCNRSKDVSELHVAHKDNSSFSKETIHDLVCLCDHCYEKENSH